MSATPPTTRENAMTPSRADGRGGSSSSVCSSPAGFAAGSEMATLHRPCSEHACESDSSSSSSDDGSEDEEDGIFSMFEDHEIPMSRPSALLDITAIDDGDGDGGDAVAMVAAAATRGRKSSAVDNVGYDGVWADFDWTEGYRHVCRDNEEEIAHIPPETLREVITRQSTTRGGSGCSDGERGPIAGEAAVAILLPQTTGLQAMEVDEQHDSTPAAEAPLSPVRRRRRNSAQRQSRSRSPRTVLPSSPVPGNNLPSPPRSMKAGSIPLSTPTSSPRGYACDGRG